MSRSLLRYLKARPKANLGAPATVIINTLAIFIITQVTAVFIVVAGLSIIHPGADPSTLLDDSIAGQFFYVLIAEVLAAGLVLSIVRHRKLGLGSIGLGRKPRWGDLWRALGGFAAFYAILIVVSILINAFLPSVSTNQQQNIGFTNITTGSDNLLAFLALVILPPLGEEPLVRGYLYSGLRSRWRFWPAALLTSVLFGLAHLEFGSGTSLVWAAGIDTFVLSMVLVYMRDKTGALYAGILIHMLNNLVAFGVHFH